MKLTPIKIPGKNTRDCSKSAIAARKSSGKRGGRPRKIRDLRQLSETMEAHSETAIVPKKRSLKNLKSKKKMSALERLPVELLEKVFLFSLNPDLARASPVLAGKLSSEIVYKQTLLAAFGDSWRLWYEGQKIALNPNLTQQPNLGISPSDGKELQSSILRCRWATLSRILTARETWIQRYASDHSFRYSYFHTKHDDPLGEIKLATGTTQEYFEVDFQEFSETVYSSDNEAFYFSSRGYLPSHFDIAVGVQIPESLLLGPWTEEMVQHLFWLVKSKARVSFNNSTSGEVAMAGLKTAVMTGNTRVIQLLHWTGLDAHNDVEFMIWAFKNAGSHKRAAITQLLRLGPTYDRQSELRITLELQRMKHEALDRGALEDANFLEEMLSEDSILLNSFDSTRNWI